MIKLTEKQVQFIENALIEKCHFKNFVDVRLEIVDHIASEIEMEINTNNCSFEAAFVKTMNQWNSLILPKKISLYNHVPYIVCKLWKTLDVRFLYGNIVLAILLTFVYFKLIESQLPIVVLFAPLVVIGLVANAYLLYKKFTIKIPSTLSVYALNRLFRNTLSLIGFIFINLLLFLDTDQYNLFPLYYGLIYFSILMVGRSWVLHKHIKIEGQLLKIV